MRSRGPAGGLLTGQPADHLIVYRAAVRSQGSEVSLELELGVERPVCCGTISDTAGLDLFQIASSARKQDGFGGAEVCCLGRPSGQESSSWEVSEKSRDGVLEGEELWSPGGGRRDLQQGKRLVD